MGRCLDEVAPLVEGFYRMLERYLHRAPTIANSADMSQALQLCLVAISIEQHEAIEAVVAFIEVVYSIVAQSCTGHVEGIADERVQAGVTLTMQVVQLSPNLVQALFKLIARVPTRFVLGMIPGVLE